MVRRKSPSHFYKKCVFVQTLFSEAVSQNNDLNQLSPQVEQSTEILGKPPERVVSDAGYFSLKDREKVAEKVKVIMPGRSQAQKENKRTPDRGREGFRLPSLRTVQAGLPHTALQSVVTPSGLTD